MGEPGSVWRARAPDPATVEALRHGLQLEPLVAAALASRGVTDLESAERYLNPSVDDLLDPFGMADMDKAAERMRSF